MNKKLILSVDFDGTIAELAWPEVGALRKDADTYINLLYNEGHTIIINTCRTGKYERMAQHFLDYHGIKNHSINNHCTKHIKLYKQHIKHIYTTYQTQINTCKQRIHTCKIYI